LFHVLDAAETERHYLPIYRGEPGATPTVAPSDLPAGGLVERIGWLILGLRAPEAGGLLEAASIVLVAAAGLAALLLLARHLFSGESLEAVAVRIASTARLGPPEPSALYRYRGARERVRRALDEALLGCGMPRTATPREAFSRLGAPEPRDVEVVLYSECGEEGCGGADARALDSLRRLASSCRRG
jgi:hypothetical protein